MNQADSFIHRSNYRDLNHLNSDKCKSLNYSANPKHITLTYTKGNSKKQFSQQRP